jgi:chemotaxis protein methyltransferase CheR
MVELACEREDIEVELLLEAVFRFYGFDFRDYARTSLKRRIWNVVRAEQLTTVSGLQEKILHDATCFERFLMALSVNVSSMFRDPGFFEAFRAKAVPLLRTYPFVRIWQAGCSSGEEAYSMAILLQEEGLYDRCRIYATDINEEVLRKAKAAIYPIDCIPKYRDNYVKAGGKKNFASYYTSGYDHAILDSSLQANIVFSQHNLATDRCFNEFNVILCRNVAIYFNRALQDRVHRLLYESLATFGILGLGRSENLRFTPHEKEYESLDGEERLYRRTTQSSWSAPIQSASKASPST